MILNSGERFVDNAAQRPDSSTFPDFAPRYLFASATHVCLGVPGRERHVRAYTVAVKSKHMMPLPIDSYLPDTMAMNFTAAAEPVLLA